MPVHAWPGPLIRLPTRPELRQRQRPLQSSNANYWTLLRSCCGLDNFCQYVRIGGNGPDAGACSYALKFAEGEGIYGSGLSQIDKLGNAAHTSGSDMDLRRPATP